MLPERFWAKVDIPAESEECWLWVGARSTNGYGRFFFGDHQWQAHRLLWESLSGPAPGLDIDHLCRVRHCVNPKHLRAVPRRINVLAGVGPAAQNAVKTECPLGHPYDDANTYWYRGKRQCQTCRLVRVRHQNEARRLQRIEGRR